MYKAEDAASITVLGLLNHVNINHLKRFQYSFLENTTVETVSSNDCCNTSIIKTCTAKVSSSAYTVSYVFSSCMRNVIDEMATYECGVILFMISLYWGSKVHPANGITDESEIKCCTGTVLSNLVLGDKTE